MRPLYTMAVSGPGKRQAPVGLLAPAWSAPTDMLHMTSAGRLCSMPKCLQTPPQRAFGSAATSPAAAGPFHRVFLSPGTAATGGSLGESEGPILMQVRLVLLCLSSTCRQLPAVLRSCNLCSHAYFAVDCGLHCSPRVVRATAACAPISSHPQPCAPLPFAAMAAGPPTHRHSQPSACSAFCCHHCQVRERRLLDQRPPLSAVPAMPFLAGVERLTVRAWPVVEQMVGATFEVCAVAISACPRARFVAVASGRLLCILHRQACVLL